MYVSSTFIFKQISTLKQLRCTLTTNVVSTLIQRWCVCWVVLLGLNSLLMCDEIIDDMLFMQRRNFSLVARYSLQNSLVTRGRSCSLQKITPYLLQNTLVTRCRSYSLQKITCYSLQKFTRYWLQHSLVARNHSLLVAKFACYLLKQTTCYSMQKIINTR